MKKINVRTTDEKNNVVESLSKDNVMPAEVSAVLLLASPGMTVTLSIVSAE